MNKIDMLKDFVVNLVEYMELNVDDEHKKYLQELVKKLEYDWEDSK